MMIGWSWCVCVCAHQSFRLALVSLELCGVAAEFPCPNWTERTPIAISKNRVARWKQITDRCTRNPMDL